MVRRAAVYLPRRRNHSRLHEPLDGDRQLFQLQILKRVGERLGFPFEKARKPSSCFRPERLPLAAEARLCNLSHVRRQFIRLSCLVGGAAGLALPPALRYRTALRLGCLLPSPQRRACVTSAPHEPLRLTALPASQPPSRSRS
jgi:hypothetical protein